MLQTLVQLALFHLAQATVILTSALVIRPWRSLRDVANDLVPLSRWSVPRVVLAG